MKKKNESITTPTPARVGLIILATMAGIAMAAILAVAQAPDFDFSYKTAPRYVKPNGVMTYTIVAINTGDITVEDVVLSDTLPQGVTFVPGSCLYSDGTPLIRTCNPPGDPAGMWERDFAPGTRITTTFAVTVTVTADSAWWPLINHAYLDWDGGRHEMSTTTTVVLEIPDFDASYKTGVESAERGDQIVYTIVAVNTGDAVTDVTLTDPVPDGTTVADCRYDIAGGSTGLPCTPPNLWQAPLDANGRITTTLTLTLTARTLRLPLENCAYLSWHALQEEMCFTTLANPKAYIHLPVILRQWVPWYQYDIYEPNDKPSQAYGPLIEGYTYKGYIWNESDPDDYYYIIPATSNNVTVQLTNIPTNTDFDLYIYRYNGAYNQIAESNRPGPSDEQVVFTPVAGETYFIRVYPFTGHNNQQPYHLEYTQATYHLHKQKQIFR